MRSDRTGIVRIEPLERRTLLTLPLIDTNPGAPVAIFLDFDGYTFPTDHWHTALRGRTYAPFDIDSNPSSFSPAEQAKITETVRRVGAFFSPFNVRVTTIEPPPDTYTVRIVCNNQISHAEAFIFGDWTFAKLNYPTAVSHMRASTIAHEAGHVFGLTHQVDRDLTGNISLPYRVDLDPMRQSLMGVDYAGMVAKWTVGTSNAGPSPAQDDIFEITKTIRLATNLWETGLRPDDYDHMLDNPTPLIMHPTGQQMISGVIESLTDVDVFSFTSTGAQSRLIVTPDWPSGLDAKVEVYTITDTLLYAADSSASTDQQLQFTLPAGTYKIAVKSAGNYGDVGSYNVILTPVPLGWSHARLKPVGRPGYSTYASDGSITLVGSTQSGHGSESEFASTPVGSYGYLYGRFDFLSGSERGIAGLGLRESNDPGSKMVNLVIEQSPTPGGDATIKMEMRSTTGGAVTQVAFGTFTIPAGPHWLLLLRSGSTVFGMASPDNNTWNYIGSATIPVDPNTTMRIGLTAGSVVTAASPNNPGQARVRVDNLYTFAQQYIPPAQIPTTLSGLVATPSTGTSVQLTWPAASGASSYRVEHSPDGTSYSLVQTTSATSFTHDPLIGGTRHFYRIVANIGSSQSAYAPISVVNKPNGYNPALIKLMRPSATTITLWWQDVHGESGVLLETAVNGGPFTTWGTWVANNPLITNGRLPIMARVDYRISPVNSAGTGASVTVTGYTRWAAPSGLQVLAAGTGLVSLQWNPVAHGQPGYVQQYRVQRLVGTSWANVGEPTTSTNLTDASPQAGGTYRVVALDPQGVPGFESNLVHTNVFPDPPINLPEPWEYTDIGEPVVPGYVEYATSSEGDWAEMYTAGDGPGEPGGAGFLYQQVTGDFVAIVSPHAIDASDPRMGLMVTTSIGSADRFVSVGTIGSSGSRIAYRLADNGQVTFGNIQSFPGVMWYRIERSGDLISTAVSSDGVGWTSMGSVQMDLPSTLLVGMYGGNGSASASERAYLGFYHWSLQSGSPLMMAAPDDMAFRSTFSATRLFDSDDESFDALYAIA